MAGDFRADPDDVAQRTGDTRTHVDDLPFRSGCLQKLAISQHDRSDIAEIPPHFGVAQLDGRGARCEMRNDLGDQEIGRLTDPV